MNVINAVLNSIDIGPAKQHENLKMFPLFSCQAVTEVDYITLDEAIGLDEVEITETSLEGSVSELFLKNKGKHPVLILDGETLVGAKQDRTVNLTILAPACSRIILPVSCVESGRWSKSRKGFTTSKYSHFASGRGDRIMDVSKSLASDESRTSDQSSVWSSIDHMFESSDLASSTSSMVDIYDNSETEVEEFVDVITPTNGQIGAVFVRNNSVSGVELFESPNILSKLFDKILRSHALEAVVLESHNHQSHTHDKIVQFLSDIEKATTLQYEAVGLGNDIRLNGDLTIGAALARKNKLIHLASYSRLDVYCHRLKSCCQRLKL